MTIDTSKWDKVSFGDVARCLTVATKDPLSEGLDRYVGLEHIEPGNIHIKSWGDVAKGTTFTRVFRKGQVLFGKRRAYQKKAALAEFDGICSGDILVCEAIEGKLIPELLPFVVQSDRFFDFAIKTSAGSLSPRTKFKDLAKFSLKLPSKRDDQKRIAELLWSIDKVIEKWQRVLLVSDVLYQRYGRDYLLSDDLKKQELSAVADINMGQSPPGNAYNEEGKGVPFLQGNAEFGEVSPKHIKWTSITTKLASKGDILLSVRAPVGEINIADQKYCIGRGLSALSMKDKELNVFLKHVLIFLKPELEKKSTGSTFKAINKQVLETVDIPFDDKDSLLKIADRLEIMTSARKQIQSSIENTMRIQKQIINQIFG